VILRINCGGEPIAAARTPRHCATRCWRHPGADQPDELVTDVDWDEEALEGLSRKSSAWEASSEQDQLRRSIYIYSKRGLLPPLMTTFDFADTTLPCGQRDVTTSPTQALALMNNSFVHARSNALARRVVALATQDVTEQVRHAWRFTLGREPDASEAALALKHIDSQRARFADDSDFLALASLCHVLLNSNEFLYVD